MRTRWRELGRPGGIKRTTRSEADTEYVELGMDGNMADDLLVDHHNIRRYRWWHVLGDSLGLLNTSAGFGLRSSVHLNIRL
jgi:hypothetical protein